MEVVQVKTANAVRWDTHSNKIYFDVDRDSLAGRLVLRKTPDGKIDMHILKSERLPVRVG